MATDQGLYGSNTAANIPRVFLAELIGTFLLVVAGTAAVVAASLYLPIAGNPIDSLTVAFSFGLALIALVFAFGHISGAHFNPAVTLGLVASRNFPVKYVPVYWIAQFGGAILAALTVFYAYGSRAKEAASLGATFPASGVTSMRALVVEAVITFLLVIVIMAVATDGRTPKAAAGTAVGFALAVAVIIGGPLTGGAANPARALGPMIIAGTFTDWWVYVAGPAIGAVLAAILYSGFLAQAEKTDATES